VKLIGEKPGSRTCQKSCAEEKKEQSFFHENSGEKSVDRIYSAQAPEITQNHRKRISRLFLGKECKRKEPSLNYFSDGS
jgi:hypothetical protein